jgi:DNA recombination protein RmuC
MTNELIISITIAFLLILNIILTITKKTKLDLEIKSSLLDTRKYVEYILTSLDKNENILKNEFQRSRQELGSASKDQRDELFTKLKDFSESLNNELTALNNQLKEKFSDFTKHQSLLNEQYERRIKEVRETIEKQLKEIREDNTRQLSEVRKTVDEKLQKTLNERLTQSFETVGNQLKSVQEGLGEMRNLANDVGGLKKVLSNVKMRGGIGEMQLSMLLEQILAPDQYETNVITKNGGLQPVEFAVKLPGKEDSIKQVWLPIDAKFPSDVYEKVQNAFDTGDPSLITNAQKELDNTIKKMAKDIKDKYIDPPHTTDFAIMFLPFEGIYAEVVRKTSLLESLQRDYKIIVTGPTTLAAILNSLQMGFKTLAIQKRSGEVWTVLSAVKNEFENFGGMMQKAQSNIQTGLNQLDQVMGVRTRAIQRKLKEVSSLNNIEPSKIIPELNEGIIDFDDDEK